MAEPTATDPSTIRAYDDADGRYLLASDLETWLRHLAGVARGGDALAATMYAPLLDRVADTIKGMTDD